MKFGGSFIQFTVILFAVTFCLEKFNCQDVFAWQVVVGRAVAVQADDNEEDDLDDEDEEFEDEADFKNNPWQIDERKLFAAKKFQLENEFAMKIKLMDNICGLDKKQQLKLKVAAKGSIEKSLVGFEKEWEQQLQRFGNFGEQNNDKKKKKRKRISKRFVIKNVNQIDAQILQLLDMSFMGGVTKKDFTDVKLWRATVKKTLNEQQQKSLDAFIEKGKIAKRNARADAFISDMRMRLALSDDQVDEFSKLVRPAFLEKDLDVSWNYDGMATMYLGSKYNKKKMKELLTKEQNLVLQIAVKPAEGYGAMFGDNQIVEAEVGFNLSPVEAFIVGFFEGLAGLADAVEETLEGVRNW